MKQHIPFAQLELSKSSILHNFNTFRSRLKSSTKLLAIIKADAYGHGASDFAGVMEEAGADYLGVAFPKLGIELRQKGIKLPILVLTAGQDDFEEMIRYDLEPGIPTLQALERICAVLRKQGRKGYPIHIKLDTGMHRLGFMEHEVDSLIMALKDAPEVEVKSIYSHLVAAEDPAEDEFSEGQFTLFEKMSGRIMEILPYKPLRHILNSAGIERFSGGHQYDMVRLGIGLYGVSAVDQSTLRPVAALRCPILQVKELSSEDGTVGYNRRGILGPGKRRIATIGIGYADGINRHLGRGRASFEVEGVLAPTVGNICMDMCMIDITGTNAGVGDVVTIFGENPTVMQIADILDTIPYEVMTSVAARVKRVFVD